MDLYQVCSNYVPGVKMGPPQVSYVLHSLIGKTRKNLLYTTRPRALIFGEPLPSLFKLCPWSQKWAHPRGHMFYIGLYREKLEKIFFL